MRPQSAKQQLPQYWNKLNNDLNDGLIKQAVPTHLQNEFFVNQYQNFLRDNSPKQAEYFNKKSHWSSDKERLQDELFQLKNKFNLINEQNQKLKTKIIQLENLEKKQEKTSYQIPVQHLNRKQSETNLVIQLKKRIQEIQKEKDFKTDELDKIKRSIKNTRQLEQDIEIKSLMDECQRLRIYINQNETEIVKTREEKEHYCQLQQQFQTQSHIISQLKSQVQALQNQNIQLENIVRNFDSKEKKNIQNLQNIKKQLQLKEKEVEIIKRQNTSRSSSRNKKDPKEQTQSNQQIGQDHSFLEKVKKLNDLEKKMKKMQQDFQQQINHENSEKMLLIQEIEHEKDQTKFWRERYEQALQQVPIQYQNQRHEFNQFQRPSSGLQRPTSGQQRPTSSHQRPISGNGQRQFQITSNKFDQYNQKKYSLFLQPQNKLSKQYKIPNSGRQENLELIGSQRNLGQYDSRNTDNSFVYNNKSTQQKTISEHQMKPLFEEIKFKLMAQRIFIKFLDLDLFDSDMQAKGTCDLDQLQIIFQREPFQFSKQNAKLLSDFIFEQTICEDKFNLYNDQIMKVLQDYIPQYKIFNSDEEKKLQKLLAERLGEPEIQQKVFQKNEDDQLGQKEINQLINKSRNKPLNNDEMDYFLMSLSEISNGVNQIKFKQYSNNYYKIIQNRHLRNLILSLKIKEENEEDNQSEINEKNSQENSNQNNNDIKQQQSQVMQSYKSKLNQSNESSYDSNQFQVQVQYQSQEYQMYDNSYKSESQDLDQSKSKSSKYTNQLKSDELSKKIPNQTKKTPEQTRKTPDQIRKSSQEVKTQIKQSNDFVKQSFEETKLSQSYKNQDLKQSLDSSKKTNQSQQSNQSYDKFILEPNNRYKFDNTQFSSQQSKSQQNEEDVSEQFEVKSIETRNSQLIKYNQQLQQLDEEVEDQYSNNYEDEDESQKTNSKHIDQIHKQIQELDKQIALQKSNQYMNQSNQDFDNNDINEDYDDDFQQEYSQELNSQLEIKQYQESIKSESVVSKVQINQGEIIEQVIKQINYKYDQNFDDDDIYDDYDV